MTTTTIYRVYRVNLDSPTWPEHMTDDEKLAAIVQAAKNDPDEVFECLEQFDVVAVMQ